MLKPRGELDFALESFGTEQRRELAMQDLERNRPIVPQVMGQEDGGHASRADLLVEAIAPVERFIERRLRIRHAVGILS